MKLSPRWAEHFDAYMKENDHHFIRGMKEYATYVSAIPEDAEGFVVHETTEYRTKLIGMGVDDDLIIIDSDRKDSRGNSCLTLTIITIDGDEDSVVILSHMLEKVLEAVKAHVPHEE